MLQNEPNTRTPTEAQPQPFDKRSDGNEMSRAMPSERILAKASEPLIRREINAVEPARTLKSLETAARERLEEAELRLAQIEERERAVCALSDRLSTKEARLAMLEETLKRERAGIDRDSADLSEQRAESERLQRKAVSALHKLDAPQKPAASANRSAAFEANALSGAECGYWEWRIDTGAFQCSRSWAEMIECGEDEIAPTLDGWMERMHLHDREAFEKALNARLRDEAFRFEAEARLKTGIGKWLWTQTVGNIVERDSTGRPVRMAGLTIDIQDRKEAEERLRSQCAEQGRVIAELKDSHALCSELEANPRSALAALAALESAPAEKQPLARALLRKSEVCLDQLHHMKNIIDALSGKRKIPEERISIAEIFQAVRSQCDPRARATGSTITAACAQSVPSALIGDEEGLHEILALLVENAIRHTNEGRIEITAQRDSEEACPEDCFRALIAVRDTGRGLTPRQLETIFKPPVDEESCPEGIAPGGLTLALAYEMCAIRGGYLWAESEQGKGSVFFFSMPFKRP